MPINSPELIIIGGFAFNLKLFAPLSHLTTSALLIDINQFPAESTLDMMTDLIATQFNKSATKHLLAYSSGGLVAIRLAQKYPQIISRIVFLNSSPKFLAKDNWQGITPVAFQQLLDRLNKLKVNQFMDYFSQLAAYPAQDNYNRELSRNYHSLADRETLLGLLKIIASSDLRDELLQLTAKLVFIYAEHDILVPNNNLAVKTYLLPKANHFQLNWPQLLPLLQELLCLAN